MKVALVHDWLITWRGGEKVLEALARLFPEADLFTLMHEPGSMPPELEARRITTAFVDRIPGARRKHRVFLPLFPLAIERLPLDGYDLVISSSHCVAKGVRVPDGVRHLSYVHAPLRYMWDRFDDYFGAGQAPALTRVAARLLRPALQAWDVAASQRVTRFVANSEHVARQIARQYGREAGVVHPPVEFERFAHLDPAKSGKGDYFLCLGALAPYKRVDLAIAACAHLGLKLKVAGAGQAEHWLSRAPSNIEALGQVSDAELVTLLHGARALIFPGEEDFGITPLEAQACGRPVIALGRGGALETVTPQTGLFFSEPTVESLVGALQRFDAWERTFSPVAARAHAAGFSLENFNAGITREVKQLLA